MAKLERRQLQKGRGKPKSSMDALEAKKDANKKWAKKMEGKERLGRIRGLKKQLEDEVKAEQKRVHDARRANQKRKEENERKNMVVQTIKNDKAIRKLSPKHRRAARIYMQHEL